MRSYLLALGLLYSGLAFAQKTGVERPKLVVGIVVDQMRWDYLYRYYDRYTDGGFKRLMNDGFNCQNTHINYLPTFTAPGHTAVYTGSVPALHGIAANDWIDNATGKKWYCTEDTTVKPLGGSMAAGRMSPANMLTSTVTDELRLATNMRSKVFGVALKDRGSILPAGHTGQAFWFDDSTGNFISSSYYGNALPTWVNNFNGKRHADSLIAQPWELLYPANSYTQSLPDNNAYEGKLGGEASPIFPHKVKYDAKAGYNWLRFMPAGNTITFKMAKACVKGEQLGQRDATDFLCVSFSATDYAGHNFAPNAVEMEDMFLKMDNELASFLNYLDKHVGQGQYTVFLTADHGGAHNAQYMKDLGIPAGFDQQTILGKSLSAYVKARMGKDSLVRMATNYQVYLDEAQIAKHKADRDGVKRAVIDWLHQQPAVAFAIDMEDMDDAVVPEPLRTMTVNGYNHNRSGCIQIILEPAWYSSSHGSTGTTHGSWNPYDAHIPLLWYGWGIPKGKTFRNVSITDIAPTLSALLYIQAPNGNVGHVITEIVDK
jgi:Uncharacterized proteins of the AP superfamily